MLSALIRQELSNGEHSFAGAGLHKSPAIWKSSWPKYVDSYSRCLRRLPLRGRSKVVGQQAGRGDEVPPPPGGESAEQVGANRPPKTRPPIIAISRLSIMVILIFMKLATVALLLITCLPRALSAQAPAQDPFLGWMDRIAQQQLDQRESAIAGILNAADANRRKQLVREKLTEILGGLPNYNGPLNPRTTDQIRNEFYTIEKVIFESLPGFYITANLYRPNQAGRYPAVLLQAGHTQEGKPEAQMVAANLAMKGFVALTYDPVGQGEREQTFIRQLGRPLAGGSVNEHIQAGAQSILIGESVARYFIWDAKRAIDYLISRPDVDPARIGAAGCSGGGATTAFIGALDPRLKAVAPACFINSYRLLFAGPDPDSEMSPPSLLTSGLDMPDYVELSAPTPWLILATEGDYFTPAGAKLVYEEAQCWFGLYGAGAEEKLRFFVGPGPHGTPLET